MGALRSIYPFYFGRRINCCSDSFLAKLVILLIVSTCGILNLGDGGGRAEYKIEGGGTEEIGGREKVGGRRGRIEQSW